MHQPDPKIILKYLKLNACTAQEWGIQLQQKTEKYMSSNIVSKRIPNHKMLTNRSDIKTFAQCHEGRGKIYRVPGPEFTTVRQPLVLILKKQGRSFFLVSEKGGKSFSQLSEKGENDLLKVFEMGKRVFFELETLGNQGNV